MKMDGAKALANPTQVLTDASYVVMDPNKFFPDIKISKLRMQYAQVFGRLMILGTSFLASSWSPSGRNGCTIVPVDECQHETDHSIGAIISM